MAEGASSTAPLLLDDSANVHDPETVALQTDEDSREREKKFEERKQAYLESLKNHQIIINKLFEAAENDEALERYTCQMIRQDTNTIRSAKLFEKQDFLPGDTSTDNLIPLLAVARLVVEGGGALSHNDDFKVKLKLICTDTKGGEENLFASVRGLGGLDTYDSLDTRYAKFQNNLDSLETSYTQRYRQQEPPPAVSLTPIYTQSKPPGAKLMTSWWKSDKFFTYFAKSAKQYKAQMALEQVVQTTHELLHTGSLYDELSQASEVGRSFKYWNPCYNLVPMLSTKFTVSGAVGWIDQHLRDEDDELYQYVVLQLSSQLEDIKWFFGLHEALEFDKESGGNEETQSLRRNVKVQIECAGILHAIFIGLEDEVRLRDFVACKDTSMVVPTLLADALVLGNFAPGFHSYNQITLDKYDPSTDCKTDDDEYEPEPLDRFASVSAVKDSIMRCNDQFRHCDDSMRTHDVPKTIVARFMFNLADQWIRTEMGLVDPHKKQYCPIIAAMLAQCNASDALKYVRRSENKPLMSARKLQLIKVERDIRNWDSDSVWIESNEHKKAVASVDKLLQNNDFKFDDIYTALKQIIDLAYVSTTNSDEIWTVDVTKGILEKLNELEKKCKTDISEAILYAEQIQKDTQKFKLSYQKNHVLPAYASVMLDAAEFEYWEGNLNTTRNAKVVEAAPRSELQFEMECNRLHAFDAWCRKHETPDNEALQHDALADANLDETMQNHIIFIEQYLRDFLERHKWSEDKTWNTFWVDDMYLQEKRVLHWKPEATTPKFDSRVMRQFEHELGNAVKSDARMSIIKRSTQKMTHKLNAVQINEKLLGDSADSVLKAIEQFDHKVKGATVASKHVNVIDIWRRFWVKVYFLYCEYPQKRWPCISPPVLKFGNNTNRTLSGPQIAAFQHAIKMVRDIFTDGFTEAVLFADLDIRLISGADYDNRAKKLFEFVNKINISTKYTACPIRTYDVENIVSVHQNKVLNVFSAMHGGSQKDPDQFLTNTPPEFKIDATLCQKILESVPFSQPWSTYFNTLGSKCNAGTSAIQSRKTGALAEYNQYYYSIVDRESLLLVFNMLSDKETIRSSQNDLQSTLQLATATNNVSPLQQLCKFLGWATIAENNEKLSRDSLINLIVEKYNEEDEPEIDEAVKKTTKLHQDKEKGKKVKQAKPLNDVQEKLKLLEDAMENWEEKYKDLQVKNEKQTVNINPSFVTEEQDQLILELIRDFTDVQTKENDSKYSLSTLKFLLAAYRVHLRKKKIKDGKQKLVPLANPRKGGTKRDLRNDFLKLSNLTKAKSILRNPSH